MKKKVERKFLYNWLYAIAVILVIFSNVFADKLEILLRLKPNIYQTNATQVHFIDVGQGDAIAIILSNGKTMLVDSGTSEYRKKLTYYLDNIVLKNNRVLDYVILTHPDTDHSSNMEYILKNYDVKNFYRPHIYEESENKKPFCFNTTYASLLTTLYDSDIEVYFNDELNIMEDDIKITSLSVFDMVDVEDLSTNEFSPVIIIEDNDKKAMLTGDITSDIEEKLIAKYDTSVLDIDILKLAHHGSKYSNSEKFIEVTSPEYVVTGVGENSHGHPSSEVLNRLLNFDGDLYKNFKNTKDNGNIIYTLESNINIDEIENIDNYNFSDYYIYSIILLLVIGYFFFLPHYKVWKKNIRFIIQNKQFEKMKQKEQNLN